MLTGLLFGLVSAFANGTSNILGAVAVRRTGLLIAPLSVLSIALAFMALSAAAAGLRFTFELVDLPLLVLLGLIVAAGFVLLYKALELGPVSVISPITASSGAASVLFAVALLGEHPTPLQWSAVPVSAVGAVLATMARRPGETGRSSIGMGPVYAALAVVTGGASNALIRIPIVAHGPVQAVVVQRFFTVLFVALFVGVVEWRRRRTREAVIVEEAPPTNRHRLRTTMLLLVAMGVIDGIGFMAFAFGQAVAPAWLLGLVSQSGRLGAVFVALFVFHEQLRPIQWVGIALVAAGLVLAVLP